MEPSGSGTLTLTPSSQAAAKGRDMWRCPTCHRAFDREGQRHSCRTVPVEDHFHHADAMRSVFDQLVTAIDHRVGECEVIALPCCVHLRDA